MEEGEAELSEPESSNAAEEAKQEDDGYGDEEAWYTSH